MDNLGLLDRGGPRRTSSDEIAGTSTKTVETLASLGLPVTLEEIREGPTVTMYGLRLGSTTSFKQEAVLDEQGLNTYNDKSHIGTKRVAVSRQVTVNQLNAALRDLKVALGTTDLRIGGAHARHQPSRG